MIIKLTEKQYNLLFEQGIGKRLAKLISVGDDVSSSISKVLRNIDVARASKFVSTEINSFSTLSKHLNEYSDIWKKILGNSEWKYLNDTLLKIKKLEESGKLQTKIKESGITKEEFLTAMPREGGMFEILYDLWDDIIEGKKVSRYSDISDDVKITKDVKTNKNKIISTDNSGRTKEIDDSGKKIDVPIEDPKAEEFFIFSDDAKSFSKNSDIFPKLDNPKDIETVVGVLKNKNIDYKTLDKHIEELGLGQWGGNMSPVWREFNVGGKPVSFRFGAKGLINFKPDFVNSKFYIEFYRDWKQNGGEKYFQEYVSDQFKKNASYWNSVAGIKWDDWFDLYDVSFGVKQERFLPDGSIKYYLTLNYEKIEKFSVSKKEFYENLIWVIDHEIGHVDQKSSNDIITQAKYNSKTYELPTDELLKHMNKKVEVGEILGYDVDWQTIDPNNQSILIDEFNKKFPEKASLDKFDKNTGKIINKDFIEFLLYKMNTDPNYHKIFKGNSLIPIKRSTDVFKVWEKAAAYRYYLPFIKDNLKKLRWSEEGYNTLLKLSDKELVNYVEKGLNNESFEWVFRKASQDLSYALNVKEIEAEFAGLISNIIKTGTDKSNKGFVTWMVDYLRSADKSKLLKGDSTLTKIFKNLSGDFKNPFKNKSGYTTQMQEFLTRMEGSHKSIYPNQVKKLYQDLYKQLYELLSKGYPALLPFAFPDGFQSLNLGYSEDEDPVYENFINKKIKITESQFKLLKEVKKKAYSFDWDDNILIMPTRIHLDYNVNGLVWVPISVSTEQFRSIRHKLGSEFRYLNDDMLQSFKDFRDYDAFLKDVQLAINNRSYGPSFNKFKEALISGSDFSIITARSNPPQALKDGIKILIDKTFSYREKDEMENNLKGLTLDEYLNLQDYHPVSSEEFIQRFDLDVDSTNPEEGKKVAFKNFVERVVEQITSVVNNSDFEGISIGFSDDDEGNVKIIEKLIEEELKKLYPKINFIIYDTSDPKNPKKKRIFIKK